MDKTLLAVFGLAGVILFIALMMIVFDFILWLVITFFVVGAGALTLSARDVDVRRTWLYRIRLYLYRHL